MILFVFTHICNYIYIDLDSDLNCYINFYISFSPFRPFFIHPAKLTYENHFHVFAGGLKTGPIFKRFADMCDKRTRWIHCYLQYFVHFQCSLHGHADSQIFIANLRQKNHQIFKTCIS